MDKYIGLEFKHKGRGPKYDCFGLVKCIYKEKLNIDLPEYVETYDFRWGESGKTHILDNLDKDFYEVKTYKRFDVILFYNPSKIVVNHMGIYLEDDKFLHIRDSVKSNINRIEGYWKSRIYKVVRYGKSSI